MKWLLALVPLVAAAPALPSFGVGDAPDPGQVGHSMHYTTSPVLTAPGQNLEGRYWWNRLPSG